MNPHVLFISDLHLAQEIPSITKHFLHFIDHQALKADAVYILGDFFELWVGDDNYNPFNHQIIEALKKATQKGVCIYFMPGNRDLLIGEKFAQAAGITLLEDPTVISLYGKSILLTHGDSLCTLDYRHQIYRKCITQPWVKKLLLSMPLSFRLKKARKIHKKSNIRNQNLPSEIGDVTDTAIKRMMKKYDTDLLIHGHTHQPGIHSITINGKPTQRIVLGAWYDNGNFLHYPYEGPFELISFTV